MSRHHKKNKMKIAGHPVSYVRDGYSVSAGAGLVVVNQDKARVLHMFKPKPGQMTRDTYLGDFRLKKADVGQEVIVTYHYDGGVTPVHGIIAKVCGNTTANILWSGGPNAQVHASRS